MTIYRALKVCAIAASAVTVAGSFAGAEPIVKYIEGLPPATTKRLTSNARGQTTAPSSRERVHTDSTIQLMKWVSPQPAKPTMSQKSKTKSPNGESGKTRISAVVGPPVAPAIRTRTKTLIQTKPATVRLVEIQPTVEPHNVKGKTAFIPGKGISTRRSDSKVVSGESTRTIVVKPVPTRSERPNRDARVRAEESKHSTERHVTTESQGKLAEYVIRSPAVGLAKHRAVEKQPSMPSFPPPLATPDKRYEHRADELTRDELGFSAIRFVRAASAMPKSELEKTIADPQPPVALQPPLIPAQPDDSPSDRPNEEHAQPQERDFGFKPICTIGVDIRTKEELLPPNVARKPFEHAGIVYHELGHSRPWCTNTYAWAATELAHRPLYFEETNLERYGYHYGVVQPVVSAAHFFGRLPAIPYMRGAWSPRESIYTLGYDRPGNRVPYYISRPPLSLQGSLFQAGATTSAIYLIP